MSEATDRARGALAANDNQRAVAIAVAAAQAGDTEAIALLALWRLTGHPLPRDLADARRLFGEAADAGDAEAALTEIALLANGTGGASDWPTALARLALAAKRFGGEAAKHLTLIERMNLTEAGLPQQVWDPDVIGQQPSIRKWSALLSPDECEHLATSVLDLLEPSTVADPRTGRQIAHPVRRSSAAVVGPTRESLPIQAITRRLAAATGTDVRQGEPIAVLHYAPGQEYLPHMDTLPNERNQRIMTVLIYLNAGYSGGETHFPANGVNVSGQLGDVIAFDNVLPDGSPDPASRHAGLPIRRGTKWLATRWIRREPLDIWAPRGQTLTPR